MCVYKVNGRSMVPCIKPEDILIVSNFFAKWPPRRGDIVVLEDPTNPLRHSIKRITALPGETVELSDGMLFIDGHHFPEPYLYGLPATINLDYQSWNLEENSYFVMGDNRTHSVDSRHQGPINIESMVAKVRFRSWPPNRWGHLS